MGYTNFNGYPDEYVDVELKQLAYKHLQLQSVKLDLMIEKVCQFWSKIEIGSKF